MTTRVGLVLVPLVVAMLVGAAVRPWVIPRRSVSALAMLSGDGATHGRHRIADRPWWRPGWGRVRRRHRHLRPDDVAAWCDDLARRLRAGASLNAALSESMGASESVRAATAPIRRALSRGATVAEAAAAPPTDRHLALACAVIAAVATVGGSAAPAIDRAATALRLRAIDRDDRATQAAQARLSAHVLTVLPMSMLAVLVLVDPDVRQAISAPAGATCVAAGAAFNLVGWWWMRHVIGGRR